MDSSSALAYGYNGLNQRIWLEQDGSSRELTLDINRPFEQVLSDGSKDYLYGLGRIGELGGDGWLYALGDNLGSVRQATDHAGRVKLSRDYSPFGTLTDETAFADSSFGFTGEWSEPTGLINLRARYYAPEQGRFTTRDPFPGIASSPASLHPYLYVLNNPLIYTDPGGEFGLLAAIAIGALAGAAIGGLWNYGTQIYENMTQCGMGFWDAAALRNIDGSRLGMAMLEGGLFGAVGALTGGLLAMAEIGGLAAFAYSGFVDIGLGFAWDMSVHGYTPSEAFFSNVLSFGIGAGIGYGIKGLGKSLRGLIPNDTITNPVPDRLARVVPARWVDTPTLGAPGTFDAFVTAADDISGISTSRELAERLALFDDAGQLIEGPFAVLEFDTPSTGIASPVFRDNPGFVGGGRTAGGAREFVVPNLNVDDLGDLAKRIIE
jgi:RHS repeat-associated protein